MYRRILGRTVTIVASLCISLTAHAADLIANGVERDGTLAGGASFIATEFSDQTLVVTDDDGGIVVPHSDEVSISDGNFAVEFWYRPTRSFTGAWRQVMFKGGAALERNFALWMRPGDNRLEYRLSTTGGQNQGGVSASALEIDQWHHIAYVRRGNTLRLYLNGRQDASATISGAPIEYTTPLYIGDSPFYVAAEGQYANVNVYHREMSTLEVRSAFKARRPDRNLEEQGVMAGSPEYFAEAGRFGQSLRLDNPDDAVVLPNSIVLRPNTSNFSVAMWLRLDGSISPDTQVLLHKGANDTQRTFALYRVANSNRLSYRISTSAGTNLGGESNASLTPGQWTHVTYVKNGNNLQLFIDGVLDSSTALSGNPVYNNGPLYIGNDGIFDAAPISIDDLSVYNYEMRADDIVRTMAEQHGDPANLGEWGPITPWPVIPVSLANLPDGRILAFSGSERTTWPRPERTYSAVWDPATGEFDDLFQDGHNMFCAHLVMTENGEVFVNGGRNSGNSPWTTLFDYQQGRWQQIENMASGGRWYPVSNALPTGEVMTSMGSATNFRNPDKWSERNSWSVLNGVDYVNMRQTNGGTSGQQRWWPVLTVAPNGDVFHYWNGQENHFIDTDGTGTVRDANAVLDEDQPTGVYIQYDAGRMLMSGGNQGSRTIHGNNDRAYTIDLNGATPVIQQTGRMAFGRSYHNLVPLPNGEVMALGGSRYSGSFNNRGAVYAGEIWNPNTGEWRATAPAGVVRTYHSTAMLMPDGRVISAGGGYGSGNEWINGSSHQNSQVYSPAYLFDADGMPADRPSITSAPGAIRAGQSFVINASGNVTRFSMVRMGATTHAVNTDSRFLWLDTVANGGGSFTLTPNANPNIVIPGYWMVFALDANDVPSEAHIVRVERQVVVSTPGDIRYVKLIANSEVNGNPWTSVAELNVMDGDGNAIDRDAWQVDADSSEFPTNAPARAIDGNPATIWHTNFTDFDGTANDAPHPHEITVDLGAGYSITGLSYLPRQDASANGRIADYDVQVSSDGVSFTSVATGTFVNSTDEQIVEIGSNLDTVMLVQADPSADGQAASFSVSADNALDYVWSWGDGTSDSTSGNSSISHAFASPGRYVIVVTASDPESGASRTFEIVHVVYDRSIDIDDPNRWYASTAISFHPTRNELWNVNPDNNTVSVTDTTTFALLAEIPVGEQPSALAFDRNGRVWVTNKLSGTLSIIDPGSYSLTRTVTMPNVNSRPHGIIAATRRSNMIVALEGDNMLARVRQNNGRVDRLRDTVPNPRHLSNDPNSREMFVTSFITAPVPGEWGANPDPSAGVAALEVRNYANMRDLTVANLQYSDVARSENSGPGIPNYVGAPAIHPAGEVAYLPSKQDNILGGAIRTGGVLTFDQAVRAISSQIQIAGGATSEVLANRIEHDNASVASAALYGPYGVHLFTALEGNRQVAISLPDNNAELIRFDVGRAPQGLALSPDGMTLAVHNFMDRTVQFIDISAVVNQGALEVTSLATVSTVGSEILTPEVLAGKQLFYDARDDRLAALDYMSCASCHEDGGHDGRVWDFSQFGEGVRNTISLRGKGGMDHGLLHWTGNFDEVQDFEGQIREFAGGLGLMSDAAFFAGTRSEPLGDSKTGISADLDALSAYMASLTTADTRTLEGSGLSSAGLRGQSLVASSGCVSCHSGTNQTDSVSGARHDIGTLDAASGLRLGLGLDGLDTPTLNGLATSAPYLHDGSAQTVQDAIAA
ncbi:MAG: LamG-like jellyroll fold domain-containing protein, partial [Pseudomonadota bacterium]